MKNKFFIVIIISTFTLIVSCNLFKRSDKPKRKGPKITTKRCVLVKTFTTNNGYIKNLPLSCENLPERITYVEFYAREPLYLCDCKKLSYPIPEIERCSKWEDSQEIEDLIILPDSLKQNLICNN